MKKEKQMKGEVEKVKNLKNKEKTKMLQIYYILTAYIEK